MRVRVEPHAVERFIQRHAPDLTVEEARAFLEEAWPTAGRMKARSVKGDEQWQLDEPRCVLIVKRDADGTVAIATVLPAQDLLGLPEEAIDWLHELAGLHHNVADAAARVERVVTEPAATSPRKVQVRVAQAAVDNLCFQIASADRGGSTRRGRGARACRARGG